MGSLLQNEIINIENQDIDRSLHFIYCFIMALSTLNSPLKAQAFLQEWSSLNLNLNDPLYKLIECVFNNNIHCNILNGRVFSHLELIKNESTKISSILMPFSNISVAKQWNSLPILTKVTTSTITCRKNVYLIDVNILKPLCEFIIDNSHCQLSSEQEKLGHCIIGYLLCFGNITLFLNRGIYDLIKILQLRDHTWHYNTIKKQCYLEGLNITSLIKYFETPYKQIIKLYYNNALQEIITWPSNYSFMNFLIKISFNLPPSNLIWIDYKNTGLLYVYAITSYSSVRLPLSNAGLLWTIQDSSSDFFEDLETKPYKYVNADMPIDILYLTVILTSPLLRYFNPFRSRYNRLVYLYELPPLSTLNEVTGYLIKEFQLNRHKHMPLRAWLDKDRASILSNRAHNSIPQFRAILYFDITTRLEQLFNRYYSSCPTQALCDALFPVPHYIIPPTMPPSYHKCFSDINTFPPQGGLLYYILLLDDDTE